MFAPFSSITSLLFTLGKSIRAAGALLSGDDTIDAIGPTGESSHGLPAGQLPTALSARSFFS
ncbi:hypothetical protein DESC_370193 [Desulfosarcina cetonica]|nr:hypothetical protein DESC_370193 [Desulfosarcina cetonica]